MINLGGAGAVPAAMMKLGGLVMVGLGLFVATWSTTSDETGFLWRYWGQYTSAIERKLRPQFIFTKGSAIALGQLGALVALAIAQVGIGVPFWYAAVLAIIIGPILWIEKMRRERVVLLEFQLDNFILGLGNALKTTPSIGGALASVVSILQDPTRQEVDLCVKEMKVGSTLDQALLHMASRIGSRQYDSALAAILIGRQVGGNLPKVLEATANSLREMARLDGVVRSKTAEGKMQLYVLGSLPLAMIFLLDYMTPGYFKPLGQSVTGYMITFFCGIMWVGAMVSARKILNVDI